MFSDMGSIPIISTKAKGRPFGWPFALVEMMLEPSIRFLFLIFSPFFTRRSSLSFSAILRRMLGSRERRKGASSLLVSDKVFSAEAAAGGSRIPSEMGTKKHLYSR